MRGPAWQARFRGPLVAAALVIAVTATLVIRAISSGDASSHSKGKVANSRVTLSVAGTKVRIPAVARCPFPAPFDFGDCLKRSFPKSVIPVVRSQPVGSRYVFAFPPVGRVEARLYDQQKGRRVRVGRWSEITQATDAATIATYEFRDPRSRPTLRRADTLRVLIFEDRAVLGIELALPAAG